MSEHTPGPWKIVSKRANEAAGAPVESEVRGGNFVIVRLGQIRNEANARLIAAAPDLLEVAQLIAGAKADWLDVVHYMNDRGDSAPASLSLAIERARAAIVKAESA